jgi:bifunctional DNA-binding transcriptional regulator/antitoxin component of YhaV-PrlF toxin-antitoxin module
MPDIRKDRQKQPVKIATVSSQRQITLLKDYCRRVGIQPGDKLAVWVEKGSILLQPLKRLPHHLRVSYETETIEADPQRDRPTPKRKS